MLDESIKIFLKKISRLKKNDFYAIKNWKNKHVSDD